MRMEEMVTAFFVPLHLTMFFILILFIFFENLRWEITKITHKHPTSIVYLKKNYEMKREEWSLLKMIIICKSENTSNSWMWI